MGTRVLYEIMTNVDGKPVPAVILYSNNSHNEEDPVARFETIVDNADPIAVKWYGFGRTAILEEMLGARYETTWNLHRKGDRYYHIVDEPYGDYEFIMRLDMDGNVTRIENKEG